MVFTFLCITCVYADIETSFGSDMQINISTKVPTYSWSLDGNVFFWVNYPFLAGIKFDYQENFQRISILGAVRLSPDNWIVKMDLLAGGGLASVYYSEWKYPFFTAGVSPKIFIGNELYGAFIHTSVYIMDIQTDSKSLTYLTGSAGVGFYF